MPDRY